jgi:hypothetical protein
MDIAESVRLFLCPFHKNNNMAVSPRALVVMAKASLFEMLCTTGSETVLFFNVQKFKVMETNLLAAKPRAKKRIEKQSTSTLGKFQQMLQEFVETLSSDDPEMPLLLTFSRDGNLYSVTGDNLDGCVITLSVYLED